MGTLTDLTNARIKSNAKTLYGTVLTRPALLVSDGINLTYCCDVQIGANDVTGRINQIKYLLGVPGASHYNPLNDPLTTSNILRNVPIARANYDLIYADIGNAVILTRSASGQWEVTGFAQERPGTVTLVPVDLGTLTIGPIEDLSVTSRMLMLGELKDYGGGFGVIPLGAIAVFVGGVFKEIRV